LARQSAMAESGESMPDGRRVRISSVIISALVVAALGVEAVRCASFVRPRWWCLHGGPIPEFADSFWSVQADAGQFWLHVRWLTEQPYASAWNYRHFGPFGYLRDLEPLYKNGRPEAGASVKQVSLYAELWACVGLLGAYPAIAYWRGPRRRRIRYARGRCIECGYDLTGNTSGVCSECGRAIAGSPPRIPWGQRTAGVVVLVLALASVFVGSFTNVLAPVRQQVLMGLVLLAVGAELVRARPVGILVAALGVCMAVLGVWRAASLGLWLMKADDPSLLITYNCFTWIGYALIGVMIVVVAVWWPRRRQEAYGRRAPSEV
jgi:hypothetical protein